MFRQFPNGHDFGKASFNATSLKVAAGLRGVADDLDSLSPPSRALVAHETLVNDLRSMEQSFRSLALDSQNRDFTGAHRDLDTASRALTNINRLVKRVLAQTQT